MRFVLGLVLVASACPGWAQEPWAPIVRTVPPAGIALDQATQEELLQRLQSVEQRAGALARHPLAADVLVFTKAVRYAVELGEFYQAKDVAKAHDLLREAEHRLAAGERGTTPWTTARGTIVRGFVSAVDGSVQPYGLVIPVGHDPDAESPLYVWLHGRGDQTTDLHFVHQRLKQLGQIAPPGALVLHPFGRQCLGYKSAGQTDVLEAVAHVRQHYRIDPRRIALIGFSMGGAGAWHLGAHYADQWVAVSPGAGFAETARYQRLTPDQYPPWYEQRLWGQYDVPAYVRNLFNVPVVAYSGELDKQIQAARVMEEAYAAHGRELLHLIGPGVEHKYHPATLQDLLRRLDELAQAGQDVAPRRVFLQTQTLRYGRMFWVEALGLEEHWRDSRIDANLADEGRLEIATVNVRSLAVTPPGGSVRQIEIDGQSLAVPAGANRQRLVLTRGESWALEQATNLSGLAKRPGLQGPIDDAFCEPFLFVRPTAEGQFPDVNRWVEFELPHQVERWRALFRGELRIKDDRDVTVEDWQNYHVVLWGDPSSNVALQKLLAARDVPHALPVRWEADEVQLGSTSVAAATHVPVLIYPNPLSPHKYVVLNSGPTFREAHDRTNSLQNPKLPDWALLRIEAAPTASAAGQVIAADFFDEDWQIRQP